jgi:hypothetical protein
MNIALSPSEHTIPVSCGFKVWKLSSNPGASGPLQSPDVFPVHYSSANVIVCTKYEFAQYTAALTTPTSKLGVRHAMNKRFLIELLALFENEPLVFE